MERTSECSWVWNWPNWLCELFSFMPLNCSDWMLWAAVRPSVQLHLSVHLLLSVCLHGCLSICQLFNQLPSLRLCLWDTDPMKGIERVPAGDLLKTFYCMNGGCKAKQVSSTALITWIIICIENKTKIKQSIWIQFEATLRNFSWHSQH